MALNIAMSGLCGGAGRWPTCGGRWLLCDTLAHRHRFLRGNLPPCRTCFTLSSHDVFGNKPTPTFHCSGQQSTDPIGLALADSFLPREDDQFQGQALRAGHYPSVHPSTVSHRQLEAMMSEPGVEVDHPGAWHSAVEETAQRPRATGRESP
jgi:hypothetical protein